MPVRLVPPGAWESPSAAACSESYHLLLFVFDYHRFLFLYAWMVWWVIIDFFPPLYSLLRLMTLLLFASLVERQVCPTHAQRSVFAFQGRCVFYRFDNFCVCVYVLDCFTLFLISLSLSGNPKGAMLTHRNILSNVSAFTKITEVKSKIYNVKNSQLVNVIEQLIHFL